MKKNILHFLLLISICYQGCNKSNLESNLLTTETENLIIDPIPLYCYEINEGKPYTNSLVLNKEFSGRVAVSTEIDTINLKLVNIRILKTFLRDNRDSSSFAEFQNTDFDKQPEYPKELLDILPFIEEYIDTVKVTKINQPKSCVVPNSYSMLLKIE